MNTSEEYAQMMRQKYKGVIKMPLHAAWEFVSRPKAELPWERDHKRLVTLSRSHRWVLGLDLQHILKQKGKTVIVTDTEQQILFVSEEFCKMTGYKEEEALGKKPSFLQGAETSKEVKMIIGQGIQDREIVAARILNYRKNGRTYTCEVEIHPIFNSSNELVNFLAIENEVKHARKRDI